MAENLKYPIVEVHWNDAWSSSGWIHPEPLMKELENYPKGNPCWTIGYMMEKSKSRVVLLGSVSDDEVGELFIIPRGMVESITVLREKGKK